MTLLRITTGVLLLLLWSVACRNGRLENVDIPVGFDEGVLLERRSNLSSLIPAEELAPILGKERKQIIRHRKNYDPDAARHATVFSWPSGQSIKIEGIEGTVDAFHSISIGYVQEMAPERFEQRYGDGVALMQEIDALANNSDIDTDIALEEAAYLAEQAKATSYEHLDGLGVLAYWEMPRQALHIHTGNTSFTVTVNMGGDERKSQSMALRVANLMLKGATK